MILSIFCLDINFSVSIETKHGPFAKTLQEPQRKYFSNLCSCFYSQASQPMFLENPV